MYSISDVKNEISQVVEAARNDGAIVNPDWVTQAVMSKHDMGGVDDFFIVCSRAQVRALVGAHMRALKASEEEGAATGQLILDGFECLQASYMVETKDGDLASIPVDMCSDEQLLKKAADIRKVAAKLGRHADEIERFVAERRARGAAA